MAVQNRLLSGSQPFRITCGSPVLSQIPRFDEHRLLIEDKSQCQLSRRVLFRQAVPKQQKSKVWFLTWARWQKSSYDFSRKMREAAGFPDFLGYHESGHTPLG